jgi:hypothetical protein
MLGGGYWTGETKVTIDTQADMMNANDTAVTLGNVSAAKNWYFKKGRFLFWRAQYYFSAVPSSSGAVMVFKMPQWNGSDLVLDTDYIVNGDATTNATSAKFGDGHFFTAGGHVNENVIYCGSTISDATKRKKHVKLLNSGGGNVLDTALIAGTHIYINAMIPIVGWE